MCARVRLGLFEGDACPPGGPCRTHLCECYEVIMPAIALRGATLFHRLAKVGIVIYAIIVIRRHKVVHSFAHPARTSRPLIFREVDVWLNV